MLSNNEKIIYSGLVIVAVSVSMYFWRQSNAHKQASKTITYQDITTERNAAKARDTFQKTTVAVKNAQTAPRLGTGVRVVNDGLEDNSRDIRLESEKNHAAADSVDPSVYEAPINALETKINEKMLSDQKAAQMSDLQKRAFISEYKKRALAMGYKVELNDRLELIRADKVQNVPTKAPAAVDEVNSWEDDGAFEEE